jgi:archaellum component FlaF (FlaF/FlaG flagellin family)
MENALTGLIVTTILLLVVLTMGQTYLATQSAILESWREMEERLGERARTDLSVVSTETSVGGSSVDVTLQNDGDTKLADFERWDVIVQYHEVGGGYLQRWLPYDELGSDNSWLVNFSAGSMGSVEPRILNPGEQMVIQITLDPAVAMTTTNWVTVATPNGISASAVFTR